jgi:hypothetical protein
MRTSTLSACVGKFRVSAEITAGERAESALNQRLKDNNKEGVSPQEMISDFAVTTSS